MPTIAELLARKTELENELASVQQQLRLAEREQREKAALQALSIMNAHELSIHDVRPSYHGIKRPTIMPSEHDEPPEMVRLEQSPSAQEGQRTQTTSGGTGNAALDALLLQKAALEKKLVYARHKERLQAIAQVRAIMDENFLNTGDLAANMAKFKDRNQAT
jgi:hypothetical protein